MDTPAALKTMGRRISLEACRSSLPWLGFLFLIAGLLLLLLSTPSGVGGLPLAVRAPAPAQLLLAASPIVYWANDQVQPALAYNPGANDFLAAWEDHYYGEDWDIMVHLIGADGAAYGDTRNLTFDSNLKQMAPDLAFNTVSFEYLVVFEHAYSSTDHDLYARRLSASGEALSDWLAIVTTGEWDCNPSVTYNSTLNQYLIVWQRNASGDIEFPSYDIYAQRVNADGSLAGTLIALDAGTTDQQNPVAAYNTSAGEYLVVWQDRHAIYNDWNLMGRRLSGAGALVGSELTIEAPGLDQTRPDLVYNPALNEYFAVWEDQWGGASSDWDIKGWRLNASGGQLAWVMIAGSGTQRRMFPALSYLPAADEYLVAYEYELSISDHDLYFSRLNTSGVLRQVDAALSALSSYEGRPAAAAGSGWSHVVAWEDGRYYATSGIDLYSSAVDVLRFEGYVWEGNLGIRTTPLSGVTVSLYCSNNAGELGTLVTQGPTNASGFYRLLANAVCEYYNIIGTTPAQYEPVGAVSVGGVVISANQIQYTYPLTGKVLTGNEFWDKKTPTPTHTPTVTRTMTLTSTITATTTHTATLTRTITPTATSTTTQTVTQTGTVTRTRTITPTSTITATTTRTRTPTLTVTPTAAPPPAVITFEEGILSPELVRSQYCNYSPTSRGVEFLGSNRIFKPSSGSYSPPNALTNSYPGDEFGVLLPMEFRYTAPQSRVEFYVGLDRSYSFPVTATLYTYSSSTPGTGFVAFNTLYLGYGPTQVNHNLQVYAGSGNILSARLVFAGMSPGQGAFEVIDHLTVFNPGPPCITDLSNPSVSISDPTPGETILDPLTWLSFTAQDPDTGIAKVRVSFLDSSYATLSSWYACGGTTAPACPAPSNTITQEVVTVIHPDTAMIRVEAWDFLGLAGQATQYINYVKTGPNMNLWLTGMEITQAIQPWLPTALYQSRLAGSIPPTFAYPAAPTSVPMVAGRTTVVRLFGGVEGTAGSIPVVGARATLYCYANSSFTLPCAGYPYLSPVNGAITLDPADDLTARRDDLDKSWNFVLPEAWVQAGTIYLEGRVEPPYGVPECSTGCYDAANRMRIAGIPFNSVPGVSQTVLHQVLVNRVLDGTPMPPASQVDIDQAVEFMRKILPADEATISTAQDAAWTLNDSASLALKERCDRVLPLLQNAFPNRAGKRVVFAYVDRLYPCAGVGSGSGYAYARADSDETGTAHEIGHGVGMAHAGPPPGDYVECTEAAGGCDDDYPYPHGTTGAYGFDVFDMRVIVPGILTSSPHDVMSYGHLDSTWWISPRSYIRYYNGFTGSSLPYPSTPPPDAAPDQVPTAQPLASALLVNGFSSEEGIWDLLPIFETSLPGGDWQLPGDGAYSLELQNAAGQVLFERCFDPISGHIDANEPDPVYATPPSFGQVLPLPAGVTRIVLKLGTTVLASRARSLAAPVVNIISPTSAGFTGQPDHPLITWTASDADRDPLVFMVQYSLDGPASEQWQTLASHLNQASLAVQLELLRGSPVAAVRVLASDGFNTTLAVSPAFVVAGKPPQVEILAPAGAAVLQDSPVALRGAGWDREDGVLPDSRLRWSSSLSGDLGAGSAVDLAGLPPGTHVITFTGQDSSGLTASASIVLEVEDLPNRQPFADAGPDQSTLCCSPLLDASSSLDLDGDPLVYLWSLVSQPAGSQAALTSPESARTYLVADQPGSYTVQLVVHDRLVASLPDLVTVTVGGSDLGVCVYLPLLMR